MDRNPGKLYKVSRREKGVKRSSMESKNYDDLLLQYSELIDRGEKLFKDDELICECFLISAGDIRQSLTKSNLQEINDLPKWCLENTDLGHGCGTCIKSQKDWKHRIVIESET